MRKGRNGLAALAQEVMKVDPFSGALMIFVGRRFNAVKTLYCCLLHRSFLTVGRWVPDDETGVISTRCRGVFESRVAED